MELPGGSLSPRLGGGPPSPPGRREFKDTRLAVKPKSNQDSPPLQPLDRRGSGPHLDVKRIPSFRLPKAAGSGEQSTNSGTRTLSLREKVARLFSRWVDGVCLDGVDRCGCLDGAVEKARGWLHPSVAAKFAQAKAPEASRRWYRVHPITDELYFVRADAGIAGRTAGHPDAGVVEKLEMHNDVDDSRRSNLNSGELPVQSKVKKATFDRISLPRNIDRNIGMGDPGFNDTFVNLCKFCFDANADVVILPCKHGGFCESCLRKTLYIRPAHKGGNSCPWCRKKIIEVIKMYADGAVKGYGYAISSGCFFEGKDDN